MKKTTYFLFVLLLTGFTTVAQGQVTPKAAKSVAKPLPAYCIMKDGKMTMMKNGKPLPMTTNMTMSNGSVCMTDGTCKMKDGTTMKMKEGQCMMMNGKMTMHPGSTKRPMMKAGNKMGDMKM